MKCHSSLCGYFPKGQIIKKHEAFILHALPYRDEDKILTLFTKDSGILKAVVYRAGSKKLSPGATDPLTRVEIVLSEGRGELYKAGDITILSQNLKLRDQLDRLRAACAMGNILMQCQLPQKPAPLLYALFISYLEQIPTFKNIPLLVDSFYIKLLRHDGLLHAQPKCSLCQEVPSFLAKGESLCASHAPSDAIPFTFEELKSIHDLAYVQSYRQLEEQTISPNLSRKINELLLSCTGH